MPGTGATSSLGISLDSLAPDQLNFAPVLPGACVVPLGEADKTTAVSTFRFRGVDVQPIDGWVKYPCSGRTWGG
jgi:hypothetical protein